MELYRAEKHMTENLRRLAYESEAHWGYDNRFMETFDRRFNITEKFVCENPVYAASDSRGLLGFWGLSKREKQWELEYFYIDSRWLNTGLGRLMWEHLIRWCRENHVASLELVTSPQAAGFYQKMGARMEGEKPSVIDGRPVPFLTYSTD